MDANYRRRPTTEESAAFKARREEIRLDRLVQSVLPKRSGKIVEWQVLEGVAVGEDGIKEDFGGTPANLLYGPAVPQIPNSIDGKLPALPSAVYKT